MEMENATQIADTVERLAAAAGMLEHALERLAASHIECAAQAETGVRSSRECPEDVARIVATVDGSREIELADRLAAAEHRIAELEARHSAALEARASAPAAAASGRKTVPASAAHLLAKHGMPVEGIQAGALDAALVHLSLEQRIAVKAELMRAGMIG